MRMTSSAKLHDAGNTGFRDKENMTFHRESGEDERRRINHGRARNAKMA
jgi:hypothetical protein